MKARLSPPSRRTLLGLSMALLTNVAAGTTAIAQTDAKEEAITRFYEKAAKNASLFDFSIGSPSVPFLPLADIGPDEIPTIEAPRKFGVALASAFTGKSAEGGSIELAPVAFTNSQLSLYRYNQLDWMSRLYARSKLGAAFTPGNRAKEDGTGAKASGITLSLSTKFLDASDRALSDGKGTLLEQCLAGTDYQAAVGRHHDAAASLDAQALVIMQQRNIAPNTPAGDAITKDVQASIDGQLIDALKTQFGKCEKKVEAAFRSRAALDGGVGLRWQGDAGELKGLKKAGAMLWATFSSGDLFAHNDRKSSSLFNLHVQIVAHGRYIFSDAFVSDAGTQLGSSNSLFLAGAIQSTPARDGDDRFLWAAQLAWTKQDVPFTVADVSSKDYIRYSGILGLKLTDGLWLKAAAGRVQGRGVEKDDFLSIGFSFSPIKGSSTVSNALDTLRR